MKQHISFTCKGHPNITATHYTTLEFTRDPEITLRGNCIVGVSADFDGVQLQKLVRKPKLLRITIEIGELREEIVGESNNAFCGEKELVIRLGTFASERTLVMNANKAAKHLNRTLVNELKNPETVCHVTIEEV